MKSIILILLTTSIFATQSANTFIDIGELNGSGSSGNTLGEDRIANLDFHSKIINKLNVAEYLQINSSDQYILKTQSRNLLVSNFELINKYRSLWQKIENQRIQDSELLGEITSAEVVETNNISVKPFNIDDF